MAAHTDIGADRVAAVTAMLRALRAGGVRDERVLAAFAEVDRASFVPPDLRSHAFEDRPLPIGSGQTISQPLIVALMVEALELSPHDRVLDVGAGSGYSTAILARLAGEVVAIERQRDLAVALAARFGPPAPDGDIASSGAAGPQQDASPRSQAAAVRVRHGDGTLGWPEAAPFDAILVSATGPQLPQPLLDQLAPGGRLVMPVGVDADRQQLRRVRRGRDGELVEHDMGWVRFVPLVGAAGWLADGPGGVRGGT